MHYGAAKRKTSVQPRFLLILFAVFLLTLTIATIRYTKLYQTQKALANEVRVAINEASFENAELRRTLAFMQTEQYVERQARREYGMIAQGDIRFVADVSSYSGVVSAWSSVEDSSLLTVPED